MLYQMFESSGTFFFIKAYKPFRTAIWKRNIEYKNFIVIGTNSILDFITILILLSFNHYAGIAGTVAALVWGAISYKNRGPAMTTSRYLMRLRVIAQSCVVGAIMAGIGVTAVQDSLEAKDKKKA